MSDLPSEKMQEAPPFTYCAFEYFGPFYIKDKRKKSNGMDLCFFVLKAELYT